LPSGLRRQRKTCRSLVRRQQETFLNISGLDNILHAIKEVFSSLYNDRAISYRVHQASRMTTFAFAGVQRMVRSDWVHRV
jgi:pyruvate,water dikinase